MATRNTSVLRILLVLALAAVTCGTAAGTNTLSQIVVVFKTHFDIGYTDMATNIVQRYRTKMIDQALAARKDARAWKALMRRAMEKDFSWERSARSYVELYRSAMSRV